MIIQIYFNILIFPASLFYILFYYRFHKQFIKQRRQRYGGGGLEQKLPVGTHSAYKSRRANLWAEICQKG